MKILPLTGHKLKIIMPQDLFVLHRSCWPYIFVHMSFEEPVNDTQCRISEAISMAKSRSSIRLLRARLRLPSTLSSALSQFYHRFCIGDVVCSRIWTINAALFCFILIDEVDEEALGETQLIMTGCLRPQSIDDASMRIGNFPRRSIAVFVSRLPNHRNPHTINCFNCGLITFLRSPHRRIAT